MGFLLVIPPVVACCQSSTLACYITNPSLCSKKYCRESSALNLCKTGSQASDLYGKATRTIQKTLKQRCFSDLLALQRALQKGCTNAVFRSLQQCIFVTA